MELHKYQSSVAIAHIIKHNLRQTSTGKYSNENVDATRSHLNTSLVFRGKTWQEVNAYRKKIEEKIYKIKRENLVHAMSVVIQLPRDCPPEEEELFFKTVYRFFASKFLPMGEECIYSAVVHRDEIKMMDGKRISHDHLHLSFIPAVPDKKHPGFDFKLCADQLSRKKTLFKLHPELQKFLDENGVHATVYNKNSGGHSRNTVKLSVSQLKALSDATGLTIDHTMSVQELGELLVANRDHKNQIADLFDALSKKDSELRELIEQNGRFVAENGKLHEQHRNDENALAELKNELTKKQEHIETDSTDVWGNVGWKNLDPWQRDHIR